jgi:hypothetical protein
MSLAVSCAMDVGLVDDGLKTVCFCPAPSINAWVNKHMRIERFIKMFLEQATFRSKMGMTLDEPLAVQIFSSQGHQLVAEAREQLTRPRFYKLKALTKDQKAAFDHLNPVVLGASLTYQQEDAADMRTQRYIKNLTSMFKYSYMWIINGEGTSKPKAGHGSKLVLNPQTGICET